MKAIRSYLMCAYVAGLLPLAAQPPAQPAPPAPPPPPPAIMRMGPMAGGSYLGVGLGEIDSDRAKALNLKEEYGVEITNVDEDSPAAQAGLKRGDVVLQYNGQRVEGAEQFSRMVRETPPGSKVNLMISRGGANQTIPATVGSRRGRGPVYAGRRFEVPMPDIQIQMPDVPRAYMSWRSASLGVEAESLEGPLAEYFGVKEGVLVRSVGRNSPAEKAGLKAGDVITRIGETRVGTPKEITAAIRSAKDKTFPLTVMRERKEMKVTVTVDEEPGRRKTIRGTQQL